VLVDLSPGDVMALSSVLLEYLMHPTHTEVFVDVVNGTETTPEKLLQRFVDLGAGIGGWPDDADTQMLILALAICALDRPGWNEALLRIVQRIAPERGDYCARLFDEFKRLNDDRFRPM
jgi:hypothetical protein